VSQYVLYLPSNSNYEHIKSDIAKFRNQNTSSIYTLFPLST